MKNARNGLADAYESPRIITPCNGPNHCICLLKAA
jgi:hypothetical protein